MILTYDLSVSRFESVGKWAESCQGGGATARVSSGLGFCFGGFFGWEDYGGLFAD